MYSAFDFTYSQTGGGTVQWGGVKYDNAKGLSIAGLRCMRNPKCDESYKFGCYGSDCAGTGEVEIKKLQSISGYGDAAGCAVPPGTPFYTDAGTGVFTQDFKIPTSGVSK